MSHWIDSIVTETRPCAASSIVFVGGGARPEQMHAKLYGGRVRKGDGLDPGALNSYFAQAFLEDEGIRLIEASLGDHVARWVTFHPVSGRVVLKETGDVTFAV